ncbi:MAG: hypothetical protein ACXWWD_09025 [Chitinophagaceae bacterium]
MGLMMSLTMLTEFGVALDFTGATFESMGEGSRVQVKGDHTTCRTFPCGGGV